MTLGACGFGSLIEASGPEGSRIPSSLVGGVHGVDDTLGLAHIHS
jgi:hypothetical protein